MRDIEVEEKNNNESDNDKNKQKLIAIFAVTFIIAFVAIFKIAQLLSPAVDVEIGSGEDSEQSEQDENVRKMIDERLKWIQFEDNTVTQDNSQIEYESDEESDAENPNTEINNPSQDYPVEKQAQQEKNVPKPAAPEVGFNNIPVSSSISGNSAANEQLTPKMSKVYIGRYSTIEQAMVVQNEILNSDLGITPNIQGINGKFVLQAGVFSNKVNAVNLAEKLAQHGYSPEIVQE